MKEGENRRSVGGDMGVGGGGVEIMVDVNHNPTLEGSALPLVDGRARATNVVMPTCDVTYTSDVTPLKEAALTSGGHVTTTRVSPTLLTSEKKKSPTGSRILTGRSSELFGWLGTSFDYCFSLISPL